MDVEVNLRQFASDMLSQPCALMEKVDFSFVCGGIAHDDAGSRRHMIGTSMRTFSHGRLTRVSRVTVEHKNVNKCGRTGRK